MPYEVLLRVMSFVEDREDIFSCSYVCMQWYDVANEHYLWCNNVQYFSALLPNDAVFVLNQAGFKFAAVMLGGIKRRVNPSKWWTIDLNNLLGAVMTLREYNLAFGVDEQIVKRMYPRLCNPDVSLHVKLKFLFWLVQQGKFDQALEYLHKHPLTHPVHNNFKYMLTNMVVFDPTIDVPKMKGHALTKFVDLSDVIPAYLSD